MAFSQRVKITYLPGEAFVPDFKSQFPLKENCFGKIDGAKWKIEKLSFGEENWMCDEKWNRTVLKRDQNKNLGQGTSWSENSKYETAKYDNTKIKSKKRKKIRLDHKQKLFWHFFPLFSLFSQAHEEPFNISNSDTEPLLEKVAESPGA